jgi:hypothetical protein
MGRLLLNPRPSELVECIASSCNGIQVVSPKDSAAMRQNNRSVRQVVPPAVKLCVNYKSVNCHGVSVTADIHVWNPVFLP